MLRKTVSLLAAVLVAVLSCPAASWCAPTLPGFAETYVAPDGGVRTHRGVDLAFEAGAPITTPIDGVVSFVGRVPGTGGETVLAVTITDGDQKLTLLPLDETTVESGRLIESGAVVGSLAARGDASSDVTHLHAGLRKGDVYVDPSSLFVAVAAAPESAEGNVEIPSPTAARVSESAPSPQSKPTAVSTGVMVLSGDALSSARAAQPPATVSVADSSARATKLSSSGVQLASEARTAPLSTASGAVSMAPVSSPSLMSEGSVIAETARSAAPFVVEILQRVGSEPLAAGACAAAVLGCALLFTRRALVRRLISEEPKSDRLGSMLRALRAGDTICGLTSCSGHSAFTDPEPL